MQIRPFTPILAPVALRFGQSAVQQEALFLEAAIEGDVTKLQQLLDNPVKGFNPNAAHFDGMTAFLHAIGDRQVDAVVFLKNRPEIDKTVKNFSRQNAFNLAVSDNDNEASGPKSPVKSYLDFDRLGALIIEQLATIPGLDVNNLNDVGNAPAHTAAIYGAEESLYALAKVPGFDPNVRNPRNQNTPYHSACDAMQNTARALIATLPNVNTTLTNQDGLTGDTLYQRAKSRPMPQWGTGTM